MLNNLQQYTLLSLLFLCPSENSFRPGKALVSLCLQRNTFCTASSVSSCRWSPGGPEPEPQAKGHELPTLCIKQGLRTCHLARGMDSGKKTRNQQPPGFPVLRLGRDKSPGVPLFRVPPWKHQLKLLLYYLVIAP